MCGLCGIVGPKTGQLRDMLQSMQHRGPDSDGVFHDPKAEVQLGHRRLSIIDPHPEGRQPLQDETGRYVIVFNGEIYNYQELRSELITKGHHFRTKTDTEVIIKAYQQWGEDMPNYLRGMFAFALMDRGEDYGPEPFSGRPTDAPRQGAYLFFARDRFGIKPLLFARSGPSLVFASEITALLHSGLISPHLDPAALGDYLTAGAIYQPDSIVKDVQNLPAGHYGVYDPARRQMTEQRYWDLAVAAEPYRNDVQRMSYEERVARVRELLEDSIRAHMIADVPVGAFLSGGIDSSLTVGLMSQVSSKTVRTFSLGFVHNSEVPDEREHAAEVARHFSTDHNEVIVDPDSIPADMDQILSSMDQPTIDGVNTWLISRPTRQQVTVSLSGQGGDEIFGGYPFFRPPPRAMTIRTQGWISSYLSDAGEHRVSRRFARQHPDPLRRLSAHRTAVPFHAGLGLLNSAWRHAVPSRPYDTLVQFVRPDLDEPTQISYAEIQGYLQSTLLRDGDIMSMAHSLEIRPPLLDHPLTEFAFACPGSDMLGPTQGKQILIDAVRDILPKTVYTRSKTGFEMPFTQWLNGALNDQYRHLLDGKNAQSLMSSSGRRALVKRAHEKKLRRIDWSWFILLGWLERSPCSL